MHWLATDRNRERRAAPALMLEGAASIVSVALCHDRDRPAGDDSRLGRIARYAAGIDYHRIMDDLLEQLRVFIEAEAPGVRCLAYADTGAILERAHAQHAGLGWIGKHSGLISPEIGSWFVLGELLLDRELESDAPFEKEHCGTCHQCLDACPTGAIVAPYQVDARLCISYLTIELGTNIPRELRPRIGDWIFGCDVCQEVCPWNRFAPPAREARLHARRLEGWTLERFLELDAPGFAELFDGSPIRRTGRAAFLRNVCVALGNRGERACAPALARAVAQDPSSLVRGHAAWALGEIARRHPREQATARAVLLAATRDRIPEVREEAEFALTGLAPA
jgi:epoxyqueuosine reductase